MLNAIELGRVSSDTRQLYPVAVNFDGGKLVCPSNQFIFNRLGNSGAQRPDVCFTT